MLLTDLHIDDVTIAAALLHDVVEDTIYTIEQMKELVEEEEKIASYKGNQLPDDVLKQAKKDGFADKYISKLLDVEEKEIRNQRLAMGMHQVWEPVHVSSTKDSSYYYSTYNGKDQDEVSNNKKIMILGGGPNRIGQGIEFDYCCVHASLALKKLGFETIIVNCNPETVSTDYDTSDKLYFEPLTLEDVLSIHEKEKPLGVIAQFGGQTPLNLAAQLKKNGVNILGTTPETIDMAEDRDLFNAMMEKLEIPMPESGMAVTIDDALEIAQRIGYPLMVRPSYVLGGRGMEVVYDNESLEQYMKAAVGVTPDRPILIDRFLNNAMECEADAISDGTNVFVPAVMEHIELAGIHSGDSISVYPAKSISPKITEMIADYTGRLARALHVKGMINIQFIVYNDQVYVIEVNPRSSRTVPYISKVTGIPIVKLATKVITGAKIRDLGYEPGLQKAADYYAIKMPVFSFEKIRGADISLGPEMKSTGECLGISKSFDEALYKAFEGAGIRLPKHKQIIMTLADKDKQDGIDIAQRFEALGYKIYASRGTAKVLKENGVHAIQVNKIGQEAPTLLDLILEHKIDLVIDTPENGIERAKDGFLIRRYAIETGVHCLTSLDTAHALISSLEHAFNNQELSIVDIATIDNRG